MSQSFRQPEILEIARREGRVTVEGLAEHFGVTLQTIRRDLSDLAARAEPAHAVLEPLHRGDGQHALQHGRLSVLFIKFFQCVQSCVLAPQRAKILRLSLLRFFGAVHGPKNY